MVTHEMVVTDVTRYNDKYCVAGWDVNLGAMIRPEPSTAQAALEVSRFWEGQFAGPGKPFSVGNVVQFNAISPPDGFPYPHATEDRLVVADNKLVVLEQLTLAETVLRVAGSVSATLQSAFDQGVVRPLSGKAYVQAGHVGRSLGALELLPNQIDLFENTFPGKATKLRANVSIAGVTYNLPVTSDALIAQWHAANLAVLNADISASHRVHARIGLSRPFPAMPNGCYVQINGLYLL